jgi:hypothetical protein
MGLIGVHINNAANVNPDGLYAALKFTHPALVERLAAIDGFMAASVNLDKSASKDEIYEAYRQAWKDKIVARHGEGAFEKQGDFVKYEPIEEEEDNDDDQIKEVNEPVYEGGQKDKADDYDDRYKKVD